MEKTVWIKRCENYDESSVNQVIDELFDALGPIDSWCQPSMVVIKPNLLSAKDPSCAITTHPSIVKAVAMKFIQAGCWWKVAWANLVRILCAKHIGFVECRRLRMKSDWN